jgi:hypothetical protein
MQLSARARVANYPNTGGQMYPLKAFGLLCLTLASSTVAAQQTPSNMGVLTCTLIAGEGQARPLSCGFKPALAGGEGRYVGTIREGGASLQGKQILVWTVMAAEGMKVGAEGLAQRFSSQPGDPPVLVGKINSAIMLQPETNAGADQRDAITDIELQLTSNPV